MQRVEQRIAGAALPEFCTDLGKDISGAAICTPLTIERECQDSFVSIILTTEQQRLIILEGIVFYAFLLSLGSDTERDRPVMWSAFVSAAANHCAAHLLSNVSARQSFLTGVQEMRENRPYLNMHPDINEPVSVFTAFALRVLEILGSFDHKVFAIIIGATAEIVGRLTAVAASRARDANA
jgi:hypothetical protein